MQQTQPWLKTSAALEAFVRGFEACTVPHGEWTHAAHVGAAAFYLANHSPREALDILRDRIRAYNACGPQKPGGTGYHETLTVFWVGVVANFVACRRREQPDIALLDLVTAAVERFGAAQRLPAEFYTYPLGPNADAKARWAGPDIWNGLG